MMPFRETKSKAMRAYTQSGQYHTIVGSFIENLIVGWQSLKWFLKGLLMKYDPKKVYILGSSSLECRLYLKYVVDIDHLFLIALLHLSPRTLFWRSCFGGY